MKLVLYSGGDEKDNYHLDLEFIRLLDKKNPVVTFFPSSSYLSEVEFRQFVRHYSQFGIKRFIHFPVDVDFDKILLEEVLKSDAIHLGGGNTFYFLKHLRKAKLLGALKKFALRGGVLTGLSAGAIMMTQDIFMASYPEFDRDENSVHIKDLRSISLVNFQFFPHYRNTPRYEKSFIKLSKTDPRMIVASPDGSGLVIEEDKTKFVGKNYIFFQGKKLILNQ
ncbi:MAG: Type 1 glutamine amidotransferase-like domain-containing protein [Candidatus Caldatribacteriota bacterium]